MKIAIGSDEKTYLTDKLIEKVEALGHDVTLYGPLTDQEAYWPAVAQQVAEAVARFCSTSVSRVISATFRQTPASPLTFRSPQFQKRRSESLDGSLGRLPRPSVDDQGQSQSDA